MSKFFEDIFDVDSSDDLVDRILSKYTEGERVFDENLTVNSIDLNKREISVILFESYFEPEDIPANEFFGDMNIVDIIFIHLENGGVFRFDRDFRAFDLHVYVPKESTVCFSAETPVKIDGFNILQEKTKFPTRIYINNEDKFTIKNCILQCHTIRLENPSKVEFKNCKFEWYDKPQFEITNHSSEATLAYEKALNDDYSGFEKLGFTSNKLKIKNFTLLYIDAGISMGSHCNNTAAQYFFYKNGNWSKGNKNPGEQKFYMG